LIKNVFVLKLGIDLFVNKTGGDEHSSLLQTFVNYGRKKFKTLVPVANVIKLFPHNSVAIGTTSVKIIGKYPAGGVNYT
jgi:hypothetical protein